MRFKYGRNEDVLLSPNEGGGGAGGAGAGGNAGASGGAAGAGAGGDGGVPGSGSGTPAAGAGAPAWTSALGADLSGHPSLTKFDGVGSLGKAYVELEKKVGAKGIVPPGENASAEERRAFYTQIGCPGKPEEYGIPAVALPEELPLDTNLIGTLQKVAWEQGIPKGQWEKLATGFMEYQKAAFTQYAEQAKAASQKAVNELKAEWGAAAPAKFAEAAEAFLELFGNDKEAAEEMANLALADGTRLGDHPKMIRALSELYGKGMAEGAPIGGSAVRPGRVLSPEEAERELNRLMADEGFKKAYYDGSHPEHKAAVERRESLYAMKYPQRRPGG